MDIGDFDCNLNILMLGGCKVGKTSMVSIYCKNIFPISYKKTSGSSFAEKSIDMEDTGDEINLLIWDIAGDNIDSSINSRYFKSANAVIVVFATDDRESFDNLPEIFQKIKNECQPGTTTVLVQNKVDLIDEAKMNKREVEDFAREFRVKLYRSCCKEHLNVSEVFEYLVSRLNGTSSTITDILEVVPEIDSTTAESSKTKTTTKIVDLDEEEARKEDEARKKEEQEQNKTKTLEEPSSSIDSPKSGSMKKIRSFRESIGSADKIPTIKSPKSMSKSQSFRVAKPLDKIGSFRQRKSSEDIPHIDESKPMHKTRSFKDTASVGKMTSAKDVVDDSPKSTGKSQSPSGKGQPSSNSNTAATTKHTTADNNLDDIGTAVRETKTSSGSCCVIS